MRFVFRGAALAVLLVFALLGSSGTALAQTATASLYGDVTDPQGAAVVGARVTLTNVATQAVRSTTTDERGRYQIVGLQPGRYNLRVEVSGFRTAVRDRLELMVNTVARLNLALEIGAITETVMVTSESAPLNTTDASLGNVITPTQVMSLPLEARNPVALLTLQAGVTFSGDPTDSRSGSVSGGRSDQANVTLDGIDVNDQQTQNALTTAIPIPLESIQEFRFTTSNAGADQGRSSGGQVGFVTKSGGNDWHGSAFWTHRNTVTTANDFFNNASGIAVPKLIRNQYGGSLGGRVIRDRLFFFGVYEGNKRREEQNVLRIVPSDTLRMGSLRYRTTGGTVVTLSPADVMTIDPAGLGVNPAMLTWFQSYPSCNDNSQGLDNGLNFCGFRFNSPVALNSNVWVSRWDWNMTADGRHTVFLAGTLNDLGQDVTPSQFPGQPVQQQLLDNSKQLRATYRSFWGANLTNSFLYGFTRQGREITGGVGDVFNVRSFDNLFSNARATIRKIPLHHLKDDAVWTHGSHSVQMGFDYRWITNNRSSFANSFPTYSVNDGFCLGLCNSLVTALTDNGFPAISGSSNPYKRAIMGLFGMITTISSAAFFDGTNNILAAGQGSDRSFKVNEWEMYVQDTWRLTRDLTVTLGLRYSSFGVPYESNGLMTLPTIDVNDWFFSRARAMEQGVASNTIPLLSWELAGPANGRSSYYQPDRNNFAPNVSFAYSPSFTDGFLANIFGGPGKSVIRGGFRVVYDRVGGAFVVSQDLSGSVGLVSTLINGAGLLNHSGPACTVPPTFSCMAPRFNGVNNLPPVTNFVSVPAPGFPATPAGNFGSTGFLVDSKLRTPYSYAINLTYGRELPGNMAFEMGYIGRMGHKLLAKADYGSPLVYFRDPASGQLLADAMNNLFLLSNPDADGFGTIDVDDPAQMATITPQPFFENLFTAQAGPCPLSNLTCTATQAVFQWAQLFFPSFADSLWLLDVLGLAPADSGTFSFFQQQFQSLPAWTNLGKSNYHGMTMTMRKRYSHGLLFDFNYTWSKSMDNASTVENTSRLGGQIADVFRPNNNYSVSGFDLRHQLSVNWVYDLPFGRGKWLGGDAGSALNQIIGGWQTSGITRWRTGFPQSFENGFNFPTNYFLTGPGTQTCPVSTNATRNGAGGRPNLFGNQAQVDAVVACRFFTLMGSSGSRNTFRGPRFFNIDFGLRKHFAMPFEGHKFVFDWQVFNLFNKPNFEDRNMRTNPDGLGNFGQFTSTIGQDERNNNGRVMQFALRYEF